MNICYFNRLVMEVNIPVTVNTVDLLNFRDQS